MKDSPKVSYPKQLLTPVANFLKTQLNKLEKTKKQIDKGDPYKNLQRDSVSAAPDAEAEEQVAHLRSIAVSTAVERRIVQIKKALAMIKIGRYGVCESCGKMIDTDRLMVMPEATMCLSCEKKVERESKA